MFREADERRQVMLSQMLSSQAREKYFPQKMLWNLSFFSSFVSCDLELNNIIEFKFVSDVLTDPEVLCGGRRLG